MNRFISSMFVAAILQLPQLSIANTPDSFQTCRQMHCEVAVIGGGAGGVGAAIEAARQGKTAAIPANARVKSTVGMYVNVSSRPEEKIKHIISRNK